MNRSTGLLNKLGGIKTNLVLNPTFDTSTTGWTANNSSLAIVTNALEITGNGGGQGKAYQDFTTEVGGHFHIVVKFKVGTASGVQFLVGTPGEPDKNITDFVHAVTNYIYRHGDFIAEDATTRVTLINTDTSAGTTVLVDECRVYETFNGFGDIFEGGFIDFYQGTIPASADDAHSDLLLFRVSVDGLGGGLSWEQSINGEVAKSLTENWESEHFNAGLISWFRLYEKYDDPTTASTSRARIDGTVSVAGADLNIPALYYTSNQKKIFTYVSYVQA